MEKPSEKVCEACGKVFSCGAETGKCWCFEFEIPGENLEKLERNFKNCLCPDCLKNYEKENGNL